MERDEYLIEGALPLARAEQLRITDGRDLLVHVWQGALWLTQERDRRDIVLEAGHSFRLDRGGLMVATAWENSVLALVSPHVRRDAPVIEVRAPRIPAWRVRAERALGRLLPHAA